MKWKILESKELFATPRSRHRVDRCELPDGTIMPKYYVGEFSDWVNIVPITTAGDMVLIRQYRHAFGEVTIEVPGGSVDPEDGQDTMGAATRELAEETGYVSENVIYLGYHAPNPAGQNNKMHTYLALGCEKKLEQNLDPFEDIEVDVFSLRDVERMILDGEILHSIVLGSIYRAMLYMKFHNLGKAETT